MADTRIHPFSAFEDTGVSLMARVTGNAATNINQAAITSLTWYVYDITDEDDVTTIVDASTLTVSAVVFDALQTDARWDKDATGYNFRHDVPATAFPSEGKYRVEYRFNPASGEDFAVVFEGTVKALRSS